MMRRAACPFPSAHHVPIRLQGPDVYNPTGIVWIVHTARTSIPPQHPPRSAAIAVAESVEFFPLRIHEMFGIVVGRRRRHSVPVMECRRRAPVLYRFRTLLNVSVG